MSFIFSTSMFYLSFFPLWVSILFIDVKNIIQGGNNLWTEWISIICILIGMIISAC